LSSVSDTSDISERIFPGQFYCWTIQLEIQDAFLFSLPYRQNWKLCFDEGYGESYLELSTAINKSGEQESIDLYFKK
jgi:hypothetical protein